uniref:tyrosine-protein phosphatase non-receptor type 23 isoform X3 n=1 Tax=Pristiophorus japonicus TaxID=55135 RepID=UPI00398E4198
MEAVPRMPMIWLDLKEAGEFPFASAVRPYILKHYGENPDNYSEELKKLDQLRHSAVNVTRDFEGCSTLRKYFGQLHYLQSRIPMGSGEEAAVPVTWTEIFSGKTVTVDEICYEQACILYNLGALHSMLGAVDNRVTEEGMKVSCTHFQCSAGAFSYLRDHFNHSYSVDMSHQILNLNINLMLGQAQECLLEKSMLDNRKSFLVARISAQVVDYYKEACRALENSETASLIGKFQKDWKKLVQMKIYYYAAVAHLHMGKQSEEQQKYGERLAYFQSSLDKLNEAVKYAKGQPETVQEALRFTMDVIGGKYNSAKKDNDFIYHEAVPPLDSLTSVKGASLVKALPVNPTDPNVIGPDIFAKLVPMEAHEASSLYSEEKAKLLREVVAKIDSKNEVLEQFMDSLRIDPESIDNLDLYNHIPPVLMEKCAALSVRPDTVKSLVQSMQVLSGVYTDVEASLRELRDLIDQDELTEQKFQEATGKRTLPSGTSELSKEWSKYMEVHEKASFTNTELHKAMNLHISNLRLLSGPLEDLRAALPAPIVSDEEKGILQNMKRILLKVEEMRDQRSSLIQQLRDAIQKDDITTTLVTTDHSEMKKLFEEQLQKYDQLKVYIDQNLAAQENILKALTDANVKYAAVRKALAEAEHKWNVTIQMLVASYEAYEDLMKKSQEGKEFYADLENKVTRLLDKMKDICKSQEDQRQLILEQELKKKPPPRPTAPKPLQKTSDADLESLSSTPSSVQQPGQNIPAAMVPQSQQCHTLPPTAETQPMTLLPGSSAQGVSRMPFTPVPPHLHVGPQPALLPNQIGAPPPVSAGHLPSHPIQPVPSSAVGQIQSNAIGPGSPLPPSPAPSPQPSQGQVGTLPAAMLPTAMPGSTIIQQRPPPSLTPGATAATQPVSEVPFQRQNSSTDDLLSSSPDSQHGGPQTTVTQPLLQPTKADSKEGQKPKGIQIIEKDPYEKPEHVKKLLTELESFKTIVDSLDRPSYGTLTELDCKWKDLQDAQEKDARQLSIAIARCYTMKNRHQDIMPYDKNRIIIQSGKDDYINASMIEDLSSYCPRIIATQAPLVGTASDFWLMIYEQKVSLIVMLVSELEVEKQKVIRYFPTERGQQIVHGPITLTLTTQKITQTHVERMIGLQYRDQSLKRTIIHLQFTSWPELGLPDSKSNLLRFIQEVHGHYLHQRPLHTPIVVHCSSGVRRTGAFCLVYAAVQEVEAGNGIPDMSQIVRKMRQQRKHMLQDKLHIKFCSEAILKHVEHVLLRHGVITSFSSKAPSSSSQKVYTRQESQDLVLGGDLPISSIQATIAKLSIKTSTGIIGDSKPNSLPSFDPSFGMWSDSQTAALPMSADNLLQQDLIVEVTSAVTEPTASSQMAPSTQPVAAETNKVSLESCDSNPELDKMKLGLGNHPVTSQPAVTNHVASADSKATSLDLLASLTAEAFTLDTNPRNRQKISKHNFLQPQDGQGLQATHTGEDPLSLLDPLWTLNKT